MSTRSPDRPTRDSSERPNGRESSTGASSPPDCALSLSLLRLPARRVAAHACLPAASYRHCRASAGNPRSAPRGQPLAVPRTTQSVLIAALTEPSRIDRCSGARCARVGAHDERRRRRCTRALTHLKPQPQPCAVPCRAVAVAAALSRGRWMVNAIRAAALPALPRAAASRFSQSIALAAPRWRTAPPLGSALAERTTASVAVLAGGGIATAFSPFRRLQAHFGLGL